MIKNTPLFRALTAAIAIGALGMAAAISATPSASAATISADSQEPVTTTINCGHGISALSITPAKGFNPLTATATQLAANGFPDRPPAANAREFRQWRSFALAHPALKSSCAVLRSLPARTDIKNMSAPARPGKNGSANHALQPAASVSGATSPAVSGATGPTVSYGNSPNWAGTEVDGHDYSDAEAQWSLPAAGAISSIAAYSSSWVGLGSGDSRSAPLIQAGSESDDIDGTRAYYLWYEVYPEGAQNEITTAVAPGSTVGAHIGESYKKITGCTGWCASIHIWDYSENINEDYIAGGNWSASGQAEFIYERPCISSSSSTSCLFPYLADAAPTFTGAEAVITGGSWTELGASSLPEVNWQMQTCTGLPDMADASSVYPLGQFSDSWFNQGDNDKCGL